MSKACTHCRKPIQDRPVTNPFGEEFCTTLCKNVWMNEIHSHETDGNLPGF